jgi:hypothetical protein
LRGTTPLSHHSKKRNRCGRYSEQPCSANIDDANTCSAAATPREAANAIYAAELVGPAQTWLFTDRAHTPASDREVENATLFPEGREMKAFGIAAATVVALTPFSVAIATTHDVARAAPCAGVFANPTSCENCLHLVEVYHTANVCEKPA